MAVAYPKSVRLRKSHEFRRAMDDGGKVAGPLLLVFGRYDVDQASNPPRFGPVVSRKVGNSVIRNRVKRHLREAYRHLHERLNADERTRGLEIVAVARQAAAQADSASLRSALELGVERLVRQAKRPPA